MPSVLRTDIAQKVHLYITYAHYAIELHRERGYFKYNKGSFSAQVIRFLIKTQMNKPEDIKPKERSVLLKCVHPLVFMHIFSLCIRKSE